MNYSEFLSRIIDDGIKAAEADYKDELKLKGAKAGFEACRGLQPDQLVGLLKDSELHTRVKRSECSDDYWYWRCFELEVEWVVNCLSAILVNEGKRPLLPYLPTARAMMKAVEVVGVTPLN